MTDNVDLEAVAAELNTLTIRDVLDTHNGWRGYVLDDDQHALVMLLADILEFADRQSPRLDVTLALERAREVYADCRQ